MSKILAFIIVFALVISLAACGMTDEPDEPVGTEPTAAAEPATEPEPVPEPAIEVSEFCDPEDMPEPFEGDTAFADISLIAGERSFDAEWLYYHNIYDWRQAGISYDSINDATEELLGQPFTADALSAFKAKISDYTMLIMLSPVDGSSYDAPSITIEYDGSENTYDFEWLSSHNATEYSEAHIPADTVKDYLDALRENFWYTPEFRWIDIVYDRMVNGWE